MKKYIKILLICIIGFLLPCLLYGKIYQIPNIVSNIPPFKIKNWEKHKCIDFDNKKGFVLLYLFTSEKGIIEDFNIVMVNLSADNNEQIRYSKFLDKPISKECYPNELRNIYPVLEEYLKRISLERIPNIPIEKVNKFYVRVKISCN